MADTRSPHPVTTCSWPTCSPRMATLLFLPRPPALRISRWRMAMDTLVIALGVLFLSWTTVLESVVRAVDLDSLVGLVSTAFPIVDVIVCSAVLALGMRQPPGERLTWGLLGGGLVVLTVTDSIYTGLATEGVRNLAAHPMMAGWMIAPLLVALATMVPPSSQARVRRTGPVSLGLEFIPYVPVLVAVVVTTVQRLGPTSFHRGHRRAAPGLPAHSPGDDRGRERDADRPSAESRSRSWPGSAPSSPHPAMPSSASRSTA